VLKSDIKSCPSVTDTFSEARCATGYYYSAMHSAIKIETALNIVNSDKLQLNLIVILTVPQMKFNIITSG